MDDSAQKPSTCKETDNKSNRQESGTIQPKPGSLPCSANELSHAARALLLRLLDTDPKFRLRSLRQLQQTAFYLKYNFEHVKSKKISPRQVLEKVLDPDLSQNRRNNLVQNFISEFDQSMFL
ncbi:unnamed protein product [Euphydryas editha]|uniref:Uncharacterized protein n=1 Tax=Euphydryas editha TaxID=104508 RepID=A0AAU9UB88_EUPED|nr:unnamed protein product [Euphydryas editha]